MLQGRLRTGTYMEQLHLAPPTGSHLQTQLPASTHEDPCRRVLHPGELQECLRGPLCAQWPPGSAMRSEFRECLWLRASSGPLQPCDPDRSVIFSEAQDLLAADRRSRGNCSYGMTFICRSNDSPSSGHKRGARSWRHLTLG